MRQKWTIILIAATSLPIAATAQTPKGDKLDADAPRVVRTIPITPSFNQRWFGPAASDRWIGNQPPPSDRFAPGWPSQPPAPQNAPTGLPEATGVVPVPGNRPRHDPLPKAQTLASVAPDVCTRYGKRKVWQGRSWRCR